MAVPLRTKIAWSVIEVLDRAPVMQQPPDKVWRARRRRERLTHLPFAFLVTGRVDPGARIERGEVQLDNGTRLPVRTYRPKRAATGALPVVVNFHGGGWVSGDAYQSESWCA